MFMLTKISQLSIANPLQHFYVVKIVVSEKISGKEDHISFAIPGKNEPLRKNPREKKSIVDGLPFALTADPNSPNFLY